MKRAVLNTSTRTVEARKAADRADTLARMTVAMQQSPAWPDGLPDGAALAVAEAALDAIERKIRQ